MGEAGQVNNREWWGLWKKLNTCVLSKTTEGIRIARNFHNFFIIPEKTLNLNFYPKYHRLATNQNFKSCTMSTKCRYSPDLISGVSRVSSWVQILYEYPCFSWLRKGSFCLRTGDCVNGSVQHGTLGTTKIHTY